MTTLRIVGWTLLGCLVAIAGFLAATIRVVEPGPAPVTAPVMAAQPAAAGRYAIAHAPPPVRALPANVRFVIPVAGIDRATLRGNWGDMRGGGSRTHQGLDIMAAGGTPVLAAADGIVEKLYFSNGGGGITLYERTRDGRLVLYYAHLGGYAAGLREGQQVRAGEQIGYVGDTGNAGAGNHHLHFGVSVLAPGERWWQGTPVDPYPLLAGER